MRRMSHAASRSHRRPCSGDSRSGLQCPIWNGLPARRDLPTRSGTRTRPGPLIRRGFLACLGLLAVLTLVPLPPTGRAATAAVGLPQLRPPDLIAVDAATDARGDAGADLLSLWVRPLEGGDILVRVDMTGGPSMQSQRFWREGGRLRLGMTDARGTVLFLRELEPRRALDAGGIVDLAAAAGPDHGVSGGVSPSAVVGATAVAGEVLLMLVPGDGTLLREVAKASATEPLRIRVQSLAAAAPLPLHSDTAPPPADPVIDEIAGTYPRTAVSEAHCAFAHHGNQGLASTDVFFGRADDPQGSGFDETLRIHQTTGVPGNFHLSGPLITAAQWDANNGSPIGFNAWLATGVQAGWVAMLTSAYAQHIMPFVTDAMNSWSVHTESDMVAYRYGYVPHTAWIPERTWLDPARYPSAGVQDWPGDDFLPNGVHAVILDDDVHVAGYNNHQIHFLSNGLRIVPRDRTFTGRIVGGNGQGALDVLTGLANSGVGQYRIAVYAEDWEAAAEMGSWATATPQAKETYDWFINKVASEAWIHVWRLDDALDNPDFNGATIPQLTLGCYQEIGGTAGYGGGNNGWYTHWAGFVPYVTGGNGSGACAGTAGNCRNYGALWTAAVNKLLSVPSNNLSESGWYVLMTNLHETAWHDGFGGPISGWEHTYSAKTKNALVYAEAARWAAGLYGNPTGAFVADLDEDGYDEVVLHNERIFACFEGIGGRAVNIFAKGTGYEFSAVGVDNAYWYGTEADYNDGNHVGAFSDVGPNTQHDPYAWTIDSAAGSTVAVTFRHPGGLQKTFTLDTGQPYIRATYRTAAQTTYIQTGMSPDLLDLIWRAQMDRVWTPDRAYMGRRNPNTGATVAYVLGTAGADHQREFSGQIMKGDEIVGSGAFEFYLYAGQTSAPVGGEIAQLRALAGALVDVLGPRPESAVYLPGTDRLRVTFDQGAAPGGLVPGGFAVDGNGDGVPEVVLGAGTTVVETTPALTLSLQLTPAEAAALEALNHAALRLLVSAGSVRDAGGVAGPARTIGLSYGAATAVAIDGHVEAAQWQRPCNKVFLDPPGDSIWTASNELDGVYARWDATYLYLAIDGTASSNSWILYLDTDPGGPNGQSDLSAIDAWERGAHFLQASFKPDFEYGCYQHQGQYDSDSFFRIVSASATVNLSAQILSAFDSQHVYAGGGGSEIAIPWEVLYGLGPGHVPPGAQIGFVASLCWDPDPDGQLGGDVLPNAIAATLPNVDNHLSFVVDGDGDGLPDLEDMAGPLLLSATVQSTGGSPYRVLLAFNEAVDAGSATQPANYTIFDTQVPASTIAVTAAQSGPAPALVLLETQAVPAAGRYSLLASNVRDVSCNANAMTPNQMVAIADPVTAVPALAAGHAVLLPNVPNPFNPATSIRFFVPPHDAAARVHLTLHDLRGRLVTLLLDGVPVGIGEHRMTWAGTDQSGAAVASGEYVVRLQIGETILTRKITLAK
jgi:hypothetical protein